MNTFFRHKKRLYFWGTILLMLLVAYYFCLPKTLFNDPAATVAETQEGVLVGALIADDGQWRFPAPEHLPEKFTTCIVHFEDRYFYRHPGFNPVSIVNSLLTNIKAGKTIRGGSTLTQQVIRLSRKGKKRTYWEKLKELVLATRLELRYSKDDILTLYATHAPFGGNVVGLDMASWRYFGVPADQLSWAQSATLAVLPNAPSLIYPGKNQQLLLHKRNRLLQKLYERQEIDSLTYSLALQEKVPQKPFSLPQPAPHFIQHLKANRPGTRIKTTIDLSLQNRINQIVKKHYETLQGNGVYNAAVLVLEVPTRKVRAYVGNTPTDKAHEKDVNLIRAPRSTGSLLKPFLYAAMLDTGELLPEQLVADVPVNIDGYQPKNFSEQYDGAVSSAKALARSLNVPAVRLLQRYGLQRFRDQLTYFKLEHLTRPANHYGLSLILGGAESNLWDLCKTYAAMASTVNHYTQNSSQYFKNEFTEPTFISEQLPDFGAASAEKNIFDAGSLYLMFEAMKTVNRPEGNEFWEFFDSSKEIAWKTGTSFGNRDAWAIGVTPKYVVGVWVGNADGEGRPEVTGLQAAAPVMFDVFDGLPASPWFEKPFDALVELDVCAQSGLLPSPICPEKTIWAPRAGKRASTCPYHKVIHLDPEKQYRVNTSCQSADAMVPAVWFVLPPLMEHYYQNRHADYLTLPPLKPGCFHENEKIMDFIYPKENSIVTLAKDFDGETGGLVLKVAHSTPDTTVFWYLDQQLIGQTRQFHELNIIPEKGIHTITVVDMLGNEIKRSITVK